MILIPFVALLIGIMIPVVLGLQPVTGVSGMYFAVACLAGLDTIFGGLRSGLEGKFHTDVFVTGFVFNILVAFFLTWLGDQIGLNLYLAAVLIMGGRIYTNISLLRRIILTKIKDARERGRHQQLQQQAQQSQQAQTNA